jgi:integrase
MLARTKSKRGHARPLSDSAIVLLRQQIARLGSPSSGWLFPGANARSRRKGDCISDTCIQQVFWRICDVAEIKREDAGIGKLTRHSLRHAVVTRGFRRRHSAEAIAGMVGHTKAQAFERYRQALPGASWDVAEDHAQRAQRDRRAA